LPDFAVAAAVDVYVILVGEAAESEGMTVAEAMRSALPQLKVQVNCGGGSFKSQFKKADKSAAQFALIMGDDELANQTVSIKPLRTEAEQQIFSLADGIDFLRAQCTVSG
jgi:histidyl-tRNA synthetase